MPFFFLSFPLFECVCGGGGGGGRALAEEFHTLQACFFLYVNDIKLQYTTVFRKQQI